jgi:hypothetical protein
MRRTVCLAADREAGHAVLELEQCRLAQVTDTGTLCRVGDLLHVAAGQDDGLDLIGHRHHLVQTGTALVAFGAVAAADGLVQGDAGMHFVGGEAFGQ